MNSSTRTKFKAAMEFVYGQFEHLTDCSAWAWNPAPLAEGHRGRYLWTDGFAVVNFLTLYLETHDEKYLICAQRLIETVHSVLGFTRNGSSRLSPATDAEPLLGGLRIGKREADGEDGDGQYFHYLTIWMFALNQAGIVTHNPWFILQAASLGKAIHPKFMYNRNSNRPRMYWKMSMDLSKPLVMSEGNLDPIDGYVIYSLVNKSLQHIKHVEGTDEAASSSPTLSPAYLQLDSEIQDYKKILDIKYPNYSSSDTLDLGMTLWTSHWFTGAKDKEEGADWAKILTNKAINCLLNVTNSRKHFDRPISHRLAFREFGTVLGIKSHTGHSSSSELKPVADKILNSWEEVGFVPTPSSPAVSARLTEELKPITLVMYATALFPGAFLKKFCKWK